MRNVYDAQKINQLNKKYIRKKMIYVDNYVQGLMITSFEYTQTTNFKLRQIWMSMILKMPKKFGK